MARCERVQPSSCAHTSDNRLAQSRRIYDLLVPGPACRYRRFQLGCYARRNPRRREREEREVDDVAGLDCAWVRAADDGLATYRMPSCGCGGTHALHWRSFRIAPGY